MLFPDEKVHLIGTPVYLLAGNVLHYVVRGNFKRITNGVDDVGGYVFIIGDLLISYYIRDFPKMQDQKSENILFFGTDLSDFPQNRNRRGMVQKAG